MILKGRANDVKTMLLRIVNKGVKNLVQPEHSEWELMLKDGNEKRRSLGNIGKGHFRWDYGAHTLNDIEIKRIIEYFNILS